MNKRIITAALASVMTLAMAVSASADGSVTIGGTLTTPVTNNYILTIPATPSDLNLKSGDAQFIGTLKVDSNTDEKFNQNCGVVVSVSSANTGNLKNSLTAEQIPYTLSIGSISISNWGTTPTLYFTADTINSKADGKSLNVNVNLNGTAYKNVTDGTYQDVLTFTSKAGSFITIATDDEKAVSAVTLDFTGCSNWSQVYSKYNTVLSDEGSYLTSVQNTEYYLSKLDTDTGEWVMVNPTDAVVTSASYKWHFSD